MKVCGACGEEKPLTDFYYQKQYNHYYKNCKPCHRGITKRDRDDKGPTYTTWRAMMDRCTKPDHKSYHNYGGRGIKVCERWRTYANFLADMGERPEDPPEWEGAIAYWTLDRIDVDGDYTLWNCRWATWKQQANNRRDRQLRSDNTEGSVLAA